MAVGLIALWAAILPLTAQPAPPQAIPTPAAVSKALFLCQGKHGIDRSCAASLARALVLEASDQAVTQVSDRACRADPQVFASVDRHN
jgi:hypothetical protein